MLYSDILVSLNFKKNWNNKLKCCSDNFPTIPHISGLLENCPTNISMIRLLNKTSTKKLKILYYHLRPVKFQFSSPFFLCLSE